jgi:hypothetical protein
MLRHGKYVALLFALVAVLGVAAPASAQPDRHALFDREDAFAEFVIFDGGCAEARTVVQVGILHTSFRDIPDPAQLNVLAGVSISQFDCDGQFVLSAENSADPGVAFDVQGNLESASVDFTIDVCQTFPEPGGCFPVTVDLDFTGVGPVDRNRQHDVITEPDCLINITVTTATRDTEVAGTISFQGRTLTVSTADLTSVGAFLSSESNHILFDGNSGSCIEQ